MNITCIILTNDAKLDVSRLRTMFEEVLVLVDSAIGNSTATHIYHALDNDFATHRNVALKQAKHAWVFFIDDDESISSELAEELHHVDERFDAYQLKRTDTFMGKVLEHGETSSVRPVRFAKKTAGLWVRPVHEVWEIHGSVGQLQHVLTHVPHISIESFIEKLNRYTTIEAEHRKSTGMRFSLLQLLCFPLAKFIQNYALKGGFIDGFPGLAMAYMMSLHSLIVRVKMYETPKS